MVTDENGNPFEGVTIRVIKIGTFPAQLIKEAETDVEGNFSLEVENGTYFVIFFKYGYASHTTIIEVEGNRIEKAVEMKIIAEINFTLKDENGAPITVTNDDEPIVIRLMDGANINRHTTEIHHTQNGFGFVRANAGTYKVVIQVEGYEEYVIEEVTLVFGEILEYGEIVLVRAN